jgi:hypothetical protein
MRWPIRSDIAQDQGWDIESSKALLALEPEVVQGIVDLLDALAEAMVDLCQLALVTHHQLLGLALSLRHMLVAVLLDLLEERAHRIILLLAKRP